MAAADQLIALVTKIADKLNALNTAIGTKADIGVSSDAGNILENGSDNRPYFDGENIPIGVSGDTNNALILGSDDKPFLEDGLYVPSIRQLISGTGINPIGDLSANRNITLDFDYLDTRYGSGFKQREAVRVATTGNITLSGLQTIDGVVLVAGDRVLVRKQTNAAQNGVYIAASTAWTRATDFDEPDIEEITQGASVYVEDGTLLKGTGWTLQTPPPYVIGTTELDFIQYAGAGSYTGGNLITIDGNQINHDTGSWVAKSNLSGATVISNLSVDAYGHPTNWTTRNLTAANIGAEPAFSKNTAFNKNFGTSAGTVAQGNDSRINNGQTAYSWGNHASAGYVPSSRTITAGTGLTGGGNLGSNRTINVNFGTTAGTVSEGNHTHTFASITNKPTTLSGYGISDVYTKSESDGRYAIMNDVAANDGQLSIRTSNNSSKGLRFINNTTGQSSFIYMDDSNHLNINNSSISSRDVWVNKGGSGSLVANGGLSAGIGVIGSNANSILNLSNSGLNGSIFNYTNGGGSTNYPTEFGQALGIRGNTDQRSFFLYKPNGDNNTFYLSDYTGSNWRHQQIYHSNNHRSDSQNDARYALQTTTINAGTGLTGGGNLSANRTLSFDTSWGDSRYVAIGGSGASLTNLNGSNISSGTVSSARIGNLPASKITSGTFDNARISQSSVTQHNSAINAGMVDGYHIWSGTQAAYDAIATKDSNTLYFIT